MAKLSETGEFSEQAKQATIFKQADDDYIQQLVNKIANKNTKRTTQTWIRRFNAWKAERGISNALHEISRENLNTIVLQGAPAQSTCPLHCPFNNLLPAVSRIHQMCAWVHI